MGLPIRDDGVNEGENLTLACRNALLNMLDLRNGRAVRAHSGRADPVAPYPWRSRGIRALRGGADCMQKRLGICNARGLALNSWHDIASTNWNKGPRDKVG
jgi:hypothetical protein